MSKRFLLGLIGENIRASISPALHEDALRAAGLSGHYQLFDLELHGETLLKTFESAKQAGLAGFNVTFPYKEAIIPMLDGLSPEARSMGAVNTVTVGADGFTTGYNTDSIGFLRGFEESISASGTVGKTVVLVGAGGAGRAVAFALMELGVENLLVHDKDPRRASNLIADLTNLFGSRVGTLSQLDERVSAADGVVNATPVGMSGIPGQAVPDELVGRQQWVADVIYTPIETEFLKSAKAKGVAVMDGGGMCVHQAAESFRLFTGHTPDLQRMHRLFRKRLAARES